MNLNTALQYIVIAIVILIILAVAIKLSRKDFAIKENKLIGYLGGKDNIINAECNMSRFKVILRDVSLAQKEAIQRLGAKGIVEIDNQLKIIFDKNSKQLKKYIDEITKIEIETKTTNIRTNKEKIYDFINIFYIINL